MLSSKDCDLKSCKNRQDYINNIDECRGTAAVYRSITVGLSFFPLMGVGNFYSGNIFDGTFKVVEGIMAILSLCCCCIYICDSPHHDVEPIIACECFWSLLLMAVNIVRYTICIVSTKSLDPYVYELSLMMTTMAISLIFSCCGCASGEKRCWIASAIVNVIVVVLMETARDVYMAKYYENDWNGCPFI